jgi:hypothetical protein
MEKIVIQTELCPKCGAEQTTLAPEWACGSYRNILGTFIQHNLCKAKAIPKMRLYKSALEQIREATKYRSSLRLQAINDIADNALKEDTCSETTATK